MACSRNSVSVLIFVSPIPWPGNSMEPRGRVVSKNGVYKKYICAYIRTQRSGKDGQAGQYQHQRARLGQVVQIVWQSERLVDVHFFKHGSLYIQRVPVCPRVD